LSCGFLFLLFVACSSPEKNIVILCAGDSITESSYPRQLKRILAGNGIRAKMINQGKSGHTSGQYLAYLEANKTSMAQSMPDFILLQLGTNDIRMDHDSTTAEKFEAHMKDIITIFLGFHNRRGRKARILLGSIPPVPPGTPFPFSPESSQRAVAEINPLIQKLCRNYSLAHVDNYSIFEKNLDLLSGVHPTPQGYKLLAQNWFEALRPHLK
jgi:lysophospholipase L1-like esterase